MLRYLLRGYGDRLESRAVSEGSDRYGHQGGGQEHTTQISVIYNNNNNDKNDTIKKYSKDLSQPTQTNQKKLNQSAE